MCLGRGSVLGGVVARDEARRRGIAELPAYPAPLIATRWRAIVIRQTRPQHSTGQIQAILRPLNARSAGAVPNKYSAIGSSSVRDRWLPGHSQFWASAFARISFHASAGRIRWTWSTSCAGSSEPFCASSELHRGSRPSRTIASPYLPRVRPGSLSEGGEDGKVREVVPPLVDGPVAVSGLAVKDCSGMSVASHSGSA